MGNYFNNQFYIKSRNLLKYEEVYFGFLCNWRVVGKNGKELWGNVPLELFVRISLYWKTYNLDKMCWTEGLSLGVLQAYDITSSRFLLMVKSPPIWRGSSSTPAKAVGNCLPCNYVLGEINAILFEFFFLQQ